MLPAKLTQYIVDDNQQYHNIQKTEFRIQKNPRTPHSRTARPEPLRPMLKKILEGVRSVGAVNDCSWLRRMRQEIVFESEHCQNAADQNRPEQVRNPNVNRLASCVLEKEENAANC